MTRTVSPVFITHHEWGSLHDRHLQSCAICTLTSIYLRLMRVPFNLANTGHNQKANPGIIWFKLFGPKPVVIDSRLAGYLLYRV